MNNFKISVVALLALTTTLFSCKKDEDKAYLQPGGPMALQSNKTVLVLDQANETQPGITFTWNKANFGFQAGTGYTLEMTKVGTNWAAATSLSVDMGTKLNSAYNIGDFNKELVKFLPAFAANDIDVRIKASVGTTAAPIYSNIVRVKVTPYRQLIAYTFPKALYIAGNYQGWSPGTAPQIVDKSGTAAGGNYEGYIDFNDPAPKFKIVRGPSWGDGDHGDAGAGAMTAQGGNDFALGQGAGIYRLIANRTNLTWSATKINSWAIIGSATANGWGAETPMTYDPATKLYTITTNLTGGQFMKFRANNDWPINLGDTGNDGIMEYGGGDIPISVSGNYTITLDIMIAGNYAYTIKRN